MAQAGRETADRRSLGFDGPDRDQEGLAPNGAEGPGKARLQGRAGERPDGIADASAEAGS
jgi:hypothetical protein